MPRIKVKRDDIPTTDEWLHILDLAAILDYSRAWQVPPFKLWFQGLIALDWLFGKRIHELLKLRRKDLWFERRLLHVLFHVGKKKAKTAKIEWIPYLKVKTSRHKAIPFLRAYLKEFDAQIKNKESYLFPAQTSPKQIQVRTKFLNKAGEQEQKQYSYARVGGHVLQETARYWLDKINRQLPPGQRIWFHLGRHAIGTRMARKRKSAIQIAEVLDVTERTALVYTRHAAGVGEEWVKETE